MHKPNLRFVRTSMIKLGIVCIAMTASVIFTSQSFADPGDLYVTDLASGSVIRYAPDGTPSTFASGLVSPQGIAFDQATDTTAAYFYVADAGDGGPTSGIVYRYDRDGIRTTFATGLDNPLGLALDGAALLVAENGAGRIHRFPVNGDLGVISLFIANPIGIDTHAFDQSGFLTKFIATGDSVFSVIPEQNTVPVDIDPDDVSRGVGVSPVAGDVLVTTEAGTISKVAADGSSKTTFATGFTDPRGLAFVPPGLPLVDPGVYVADTGGSAVFRVTTSGVVVPFVTNAGSPNYLVFESQSAADPSPTPTPTPTITPIPTPTPAARAQNISTRLDVQTGDKVGIGGFIIKGSVPKLVVLRAIGPSLTALGVPGVLANPKLELHDSTGAVIATNDNWMFNSAEDKMVLTDNGLAPSDDLESALVRTLDPGPYTAIISGAGGGSGIALVEVYDLDDPAATSSELGNISTRGFVGTGDNVLIGGVIVGPVGGADAEVVIRAIGPELSNTVPPIADVLADPLLELHNSDGDTIATNDNWMDLSTEDQTVLTDNDLTPTEDSESALVEPLIAGSYTAIVSGKADTTGVALVEVYHVDTPAPAGASH